MPIHDHGYREWNEERSSLLLRWWVITKRGVSIAWQSKWVRRLVLVAWFPTLYWGMIFAGYEIYVDFHREQIQEESESIEESVDRFSSQIAVNIFNEFLPDDMQEEVRENPGEARSMVWNYLVMVFFQWPQAFLLVVLLGIVAPGLIARDIRSNAFQLYFSRSLTRTDYILGKAGVVWAYTVFITTGPALTLYIFAISISPGFRVVGDTWMLPLIILVASLVVMIPTAALILFLSSLTEKTRIAQFSWYGIWFLSWIAYSILSTNFTEGEDVNRAWEHLSLFHLLQRIEAYLFGFEESIESAVPSALLLAAVTLFCGMVVVMLLHSYLNR